MHLALEVVGHALFGSDLSGDAERLADATLDALDIVVKKARTPLAMPLRVPTPTNLVLRRAVQPPRRRGRGDARRPCRASARGGRAAARHARPAPRSRTTTTARTLSRQQVRDQVVTFIVAGHETVASALTWAWHLLAENPEAADRLRAEVDAVCPGGSPRFADLPRLPYAAAVMDEVLRLYPPAWLVTRRAREADVLAGVDVPENSLVILSPWLVHRHESAWPDPERVRPDALPRRGRVAPSRHRDGCGVPARSAPGRGCASAATWRCSRARSCWPG